MKHHHLIIITLLGTVAILLSLIVGNLYSETIALNTPTSLGISFSSTYAKELGLDPKNTFESILNDLHIKKLRLNAYWDQIESQKDQYSFTDLDWYLDQAHAHNAKVILAVGYKLPRWPECRAPKWLDGTTTETRQNEQLKFVSAVIQKYNQNTTITAFQIENEPLLEFGECPSPDKNFLEKEVALVRTQTQTQKPIILTDSGELNSWITPMKLSDIFGTTLYRVVNTPLLGNTKYPLQPWFYRVKSDLVRKIFAPNNKKTIIAELQTESWSSQPLIDTPIQEQLNQYPLSDFKQTLNYAQKIGFDEIYLWGVEWWYYMAKQGHPEYLNFAKTIF